ncbi:ATP-binding protein [Streptomyces sp. NPDC058424]|uniref:ATP-binding protein n=1 Tax=Streptomyces sp. NPDC058424 TaxID=3346491 RepID=UPI00365C3057
MARLRAEGLVDRITLLQAGRTWVWFPTLYGVQLASEWPEMRGRRPSRTVSDPTAVRLKAGHTLTVTETALVFLEDARRRGELCQPLDWIPEVHHPIGSGEAVIRDETVAAAMIDRLVHHAEVYSLKGESYRMRGRELGRVPASDRND